MRVFGKNVALEYLMSDSIINIAFIDKQFNDFKILSLLNKKNIKIERLTKKELDKIEQGLHQGIILEVADYKYGNIDSVLNLDSSLIVILDHIEDPHNFGAIIRTCEAAGVDGIIIPRNRSVEVNATVIKTSVGTANKMNIIQVTNLVNTIKLLKDYGYWVFGTDMVGDDYTTLNYRGKTAIICGNEGNGLSKLVYEHCDFIANIPMFGEVNSLNVSVATGIILFEALKSRRD